MFLFTKKNQKGFSLIEILLAGSFFVVVAIGTIAVLLNSREASRNTALFNQAVLMAEEGKDILKTIRDRDFNALNLGSNQALVFEDSKWRLKQNPEDEDDTSAGLKRRTSIESAVKDYAEVAQGLGATMIHSGSHDSNIWYDESGNNLHGTLINTPAWNASGGPGNNLPGYFSFNGANQYVEIGDSALLRLQDMTVVWWERDGHNQNANHAQVFGKGNESYMVRAGEVSGAANRSLQLRGGGIYTGTDVTNAVISGKWQMFAISWDGSDVNFYRVDDGAVTKVALSTRNIPIEENADHFGYGAQHYEGSWRRYWKGDLAGPLVFEEALKPADMWRLYNSALGEETNSVLAKIEIHFEGRGGRPVVFSVPLELWNTSFSKFVDIAMRSENYSIVDDDIGRRQDEFCYGCE